MTRERIEPIGDLRESTFEEIWRGEGYQAVREAMFPPSLSACKYCDDFIVQNRQLFGMLESGAADL